MAAAASALSPPAAMGGVDNEDSNISSPLSDVDDKDTNDEDIEHMQLDNDNQDDDEGRDTPSPAEVNDGATRGIEEDDSESALSDAQSEDHSEDNDTEAETERLYDTPRNPRQRNVTDDYPNTDQAFEHTPSKLRSTANVDQIGRDSDAESLSDDDLSTTSPVIKDDDPLKKLSELTDAALGTAAQDKTDSDRKRKRSAAAELFDPEQPLRKRPASLPATDAGADEEAVLNDDDETSAILQSAVQSAAEDGDTPRDDNDTPDENGTERSARLSRKITRNGAKRQHVSNGTDAEEEADRDTPQAQGDEEPQAREEEAEEENEEGNDLAVKNAEELERKQAAFKDWSRIEEMFGEFRDRLYKDRLQHLEEEEQSLTSAEPTHPEFLNMKQCLDDRLEQKLAVIRTEHEFRLRAHERRAVAQRAQAWSQYFQAIREKREQTLEALNKEWYDVQSSRRRAHSLPDCILLFPKDAMQRVRNAVAYNSEVSTLSGLAKYEGFPAGPEMKGASATELEDDFAAMEHTRRGQQKKQLAAAPREEFQAPTFNRLGPAGEQFLKDTPWANPNHSAHKMPQQQPSHQPTGRHDLPGSSRAPLPSSAPSEARPPVPQQQRTPLVSSRMSTSPELTRPMINQGPQAKRANNIASLGRGSKTATA
ncbi:sds3-like domain-containing protein [Sarocladium implicatum]|nr:sds3-like domain-containing protein [Sarocladium implicatum]